VKKRLREVTTMAAFMIFGMAMLALFFGALVDGDHRSDR
jgi:hypothetical protein